MVYIHFFNNKAPISLKKKEENIRLNGYNGYEPVIGLEVHAQLLTDSKIFCGCKNSFGAPPNSLTCPICLGMPGTLPVLNKKAVEFAMRMILAVNGKINHRSVFARKNYFYPDLPKGYQISQYELPIGEGGAICYDLPDGEEKSCGLIRIHLEEDAGKLIHPEYNESYTKVDLNRCGVPLIEIVSLPDIRTPEEAYGYLIKLKRILQYLEICSADMEKGNLRCDANVSVRPKGQRDYGTRTEVKNMNSFKGVERALKFEIERQVKLLESGEKVKQATLLWNEKKQEAEAMRSKEEAPDYRYFPEPDLLNLVISDEWIEQVKKDLPELPDARFKRFIKRYNIREYDVSILTDNKDIADYFEKVMIDFDDAQTAANWIQTEVLGVLRDTQKDIINYEVKPKQIAELLKKIKKGEISGKMAKTVFAEMNKTGKSPEEIIKEKGLVQISDKKILGSVIDKILKEHPENVAEYKKGKTKVVGFLVGQVMKETKGQANPSLVNELLKEKLKD